MLGQMMHRPLSIIEILRFAAETHSKSDIVSVRTEGDMHRYTYPDAYLRVCQLANAFEKLGVKAGDRIATLAWNGYRHFELYYAISGVGAVCHTINPRLSAEQMIYITQHASDSIMCVDLTFVPLVEALSEKFPPDMKYILMTDKKHMPNSKIDFICFEDFIERESTTHNWIEMPEDTASGLCYTSGTTGNPKGALYSHRSTILHAFTVAVSLGKTLTEGSRILPVVPLFHVNAWGLPYTAPLTGGSLIFPGAALDGKSLFDLMEREKVTSAWGVPTVWLGLQNEITNLGRKPERFSSVIVGGSAAPRSMIEGFEKSGVMVCHAWGMTEMSPIGTHGILSAHHDQTLSFDQKLDLKTRQGRRAFGVDLKIVDEDGKAQPHDGKSVGELYVRGNSIISGYFKNEEASNEVIDSDGWFGTGDVASIGSDGFLTIQDRAKDLIKSGGEWISSIDLENIVMSHPDVANCAVISIQHPKWDERPLLVVVPKNGVLVSKTEVDQMLLKTVAKWQLPDALEFVEELPLTATGKVSKRTLRQAFKDYKLPDMA
ncbi:MAG: long-chain fatty acid--CoA ligase [Rhodobacteraceae bacterium]|nr:long-chain fatty acid--CoA ligase [Paracoccaceae bacterium]